jgi:hypothetical protein
MTPSILLSPELRAKVEVLLRQIAKLDDTSRQYLAHQLNKMGF